jgi:penicillin-binding protein 1A
MGITKDLVTGIWTGCDERSAHFRTSETGEGSRTALPIFGKFMEKVYHDPTSGYTYGHFPKPGVTITRKYDCPSPGFLTDTLNMDSLMVDTMRRQETIRFDSVKTAVRLPEKTVIQEAPATLPEKPRVETKPEAPKVEPPKTARERRQEAREQRRSGK